LSGNLLFGLAHRNKGQFFCINADNGKVLWTGDSRQGENASMVIAGNVIFSLTNEGNLIITGVSDKLGTPIKRYNLSTTETWAHPAIAGKRMLIKDEQALLMFALE